MKQDKDDYLDDYLEFEAESNIRFDDAYEEDEPYDDEFESEFMDEKDDDGKFVKIISVLLLVIVILVAIILAFIYINNAKGDRIESETPVIEEINEEIPEEEPEEDIEVDERSFEEKDDSLSENAEDNPSEAVEEELSQKNEVETNPFSGQGLLTAHPEMMINAVTKGIDVAKYQGVIDYQKVAESGIDFVMVRVGYRDMKSGAIEADVNAKYNMQQATNHGMMIGAYFFSSAITEKEAVDEANWVADYLAKYDITYPVAFDGEGFEKASSRHHSLNKEERTNIAIAFMNQIFKRGYTPLFYASASELEDDATWDIAAIEQTYRIWVAQYQSGDRPSVDCQYAMWQSNNRASVPGISEMVDIDTAYFGYQTAVESISDEEPETAAANPEALMKFQDANETVTAKELCNLRDMPDQEKSNVVYQLPNGETVTRTGISDSGWSRVLYKGQNLYAVSSLLTKDLSVKAEQKPEADETHEHDDSQAVDQTEENVDGGSGLKTVFEARSEQVTAKIEVNLRTLPSVTNPDATVVAVLHNGEYVTRTGINVPYGWSRVEYNGQVLYCVSSFLTQ